VQPWVEISALDDAAIEQADAAGRVIAERIGSENMKIALSAGQRCSPEGLFFAGHGSTWARLAMETVVAQELVNARRMFVLDLHTGLGPQGFADLLVTYPTASVEMKLITRYLGEQARGKGRAAATGQKIGHSMIAGIERIARRAGAGCLGAAIECGTLDLDNVLTALRLEQALHVHGAGMHSRFAKIKKSLRDAFYVDTPQWKETVLTQTFRHVAGVISLLGSDAGWPRSA
jgi:hypothetical protein